MSAMPEHQPSWLPPDVESPQPPPLVRADAPEPFWAWVGAHGGAGVTTLAEAVPGGIDLGRWIPSELARRRLPMVAVCKADARGLLAARTLAARAHAAAEQVLGLVVVADIPERRRPKPLTDSLSVTRGAYPKVWEMPWVLPWRLGDAPSRVNNPPQVPELLRALWTAVGLPLPGSTQQQRKP